MRRPTKRHTVDETWTYYQAAKHVQERRIEPHAALCLHYAPLAKYLALRYLPHLKSEEQPPLLIAVAWIELSRTIDEWQHPTEGHFKDYALARIKAAVERRVADLNYL
jgi:DNA-directed RNA polymerase specialized sigma subunit